jgi:hypothetical protein
MGKPISAQRVINEELEWQEVQIQLESNWLTNRVAA